MIVRHFTGVPLIFLNNNFKKVLKYFNLFSNCSLYKRKFDDCPIVYEEIIGSNPLASGSNVTKGSSIPLVDLSLTWYFFQNLLNFSMLQNILIPTPARVEFSEKADPDQE